MATDDIDIGTSKPKGIHTVGLEPGHEILVHQTSIDHRNHSEHTSIGDTASVDHLRLDTELRGYLSGTPASAVHKHLFAFNGTEVTEQLRELGLVFYNGSTYFHYC